MNVGTRKGGYDIAGLYDLETTIGKGHFAVVKLARHVFSGLKVAVKVIDKTKLDAISKEHLFQEVTCMKLVQHPNVVRLYEVIDTQTKLYLIMELGDGGDMYDYIMKHANGLEEGMAQHYFKQIVQAISYCHKLHVVHRDLKPENVVFFEKLGIVKLTDFGFSNLFEPDKKLETSCGSLAYSAPEILLGDTYDAPAVDVWSLGVILYMLVAGTAPFNEANDSETLTMILDCKYDVPEHVSEECKELISKMLVKEPENRISLDDILKHMWMTGGDSPPLQLTPLVSRAHLSEENHNNIVQKMVAGKIATKEEVQHALEKDSYNHITATYFLLAERLLGKQQSHHVSQQRPHLQPPAIAPLALSPRVKSADAATTAERNRNSIESLVSPPGAHAPASASSMRTPPTPVNATDNSPKFKPRTLNMLQEESIEEDEEDDEAQLPSTSYNHEPRRARFDLGATRYRDDSQSEDSDHSRSSSLDRQETRNQIVPLPGRRGQPLRPLKTVRSSPNMLNEICEECESDEDGDITGRRLSPPKYRNFNNASPEVIRKLEQRKMEQRVHRKRITPRVTSASSSDASDTDETDPSKKRQKEKDKIKNRFHRRDSSDHSSDTDAGPGPAGGFGGAGRSLGGGSRGSRGRDRDSDRGGDSNSRHSPKSKDRRQSSGSNSSGSSRPNGLPTIDAKHEPENIDTDFFDKAGRKFSGISMGSNQSQESSKTHFSSNSQKYIVQEDKNKSSGNGMVFRSPLDILNEENKYKGKVINVRSKNFSDLMTRFKTDLSDSETENIGGFKTKDVVGNVKFKRRNKDKINMHECNKCDENGAVQIHDINIQSGEMGVQSTGTKCCSVV